MKKNLRLTFMRGDVLAILLVLALAGGVMAAFLPGRDDARSAVVQIWQDGRLTSELPLNADARTEAAGDYRNVIAIENGRASIIKSDCPGGDCVHSGWISAAGRSIVCLPNRVEVRIVGADSDVDFAVG